MHRELSHAEAAFARPRLAGLLLITALVVGLIALDLLPLLAEWLDPLERPRLPRQLLGVRFALAAALLGGTRILQGALARLRDGRVGADLAVALAALAAILIGEPLVAAEVVAIALVGECLEALTFARAQSAVRNLVAFFPHHCWVLRDGVETRVHTADLLAGELVLVKPGGKIPVDGTVRAGVSSLDTSALTGESLPRDVQPGSPVLAGCLNQLGTLTIATERVGQHTVAGQVVEWTTRALRDKAPLERTADRFAAWFLPAVLALALLTFLAGWFLASRASPTLAEAARRALPSALAVLVVACPCALILATPAAILAALGRLAGTGILLKSGAALERLAAVAGFAFDKTGTLTTGQLEVAGIEPAEGVSAEECLRAAATAEQGSDHPLALAIRRHAAQLHLDLPPLETAAAHPGLGLEARAQGETYRVGSPAFLQAAGLRLPEPDGAAPASEPLTRLGVARGERLLGRITLRDQIRPEAPSALRDLRQAGFDRIALLTGDSRAAAQAVAWQLDIPEVHAELLPLAKADWLARQPGSWAFVGDGINDAPALARAGVGLAVGSGADLAAEAGSILLLGDPLAHLAFLTRLARATVRTIRQNILVFALGVNLLGIALTAWIWPWLSDSPRWRQAGPIAAVVYHQLGSLAVLLNSMRLLRFEKSAPQASRAARGFARLEHRLHHALDLDRLGRRLARHRRAVLSAGIGLAALAWLASAGSRIAPDEVGVLDRWGRLVEPVLPPGWHWHAPWPIDRLHRFQPDRLQALPLGYRRLADPAPVSQAWNSPHAAETWFLPDEALFVTGDGNLVELLASVRYRLADPLQVLRSAQEPERWLRCAAESALREELAGRSFAQVLTRERPLLEAAFLRRLRPRLAGSGLAVEGLVLHDLHPPREVVAAYHEVARALEGRDQRVEAGATEALRRQREAEARALTIEAEAHGQAARTRARARSEAAEFQGWHRLMHGPPAGTEAGLAASVIAAGHRTALVIPAWGIYDGLRGADPRGRAALIRTRLVLEAVARGLADRAKVFVDADALPGRRILAPGLVPGIPRLDLPRPSPPPTPANPESVP